MNPEAQEALTRLKDKLKDKKIVHEKDGQFVTTSMAGVSAADVVALCQELPSNPRTDCLKGGSQNALEANNRPDEQVAIQLIDLEYLVKQAENPEARKPAPKPFQKLPTE